MSTELTPGCTRLLNTMIFPESGIVRAKAWTDPKRAMIEEEILISRCAMIIANWITPPVQEVPTLSGSAPNVSGGLSARRTMIDDPYLVQEWNAQHDLIQMGIVVDRVGMEPIGVVVVGRNEVDIQQFRMVDDCSVVQSQWIEVLYHVVPHMPLPTPPRQNQGPMGNTSTTLSGHKVE
ncbi:MAG: hypothetical protein IPI55_14945 [Flavobacteriales bacterium]|nr:hypothetical protein [Flavobacteriales bacterium]